MAKKSVYIVQVGGVDITSTLAPLLVSTSVSLRAGAEGDTATIILDDTGGKIEMPAIGAPIVIALGWREAGPRIVFSGTVDETRSGSSRASGRLLTISAKGFNSAGATKSRRRKHWDDATVESILADAASLSGIANVRVDPDLSTIKLKYWAMSDESFLHMGQRLAQRIGGNFSIQGDGAVMSRRGAAYTPTIVAQVGLNLHEWDVSPVLGRKLYGKVIATYFDRTAGKWEQVEVETGLQSDAVLKVSPPADDKADAQLQAEAQAEASKRAAGNGSLTIEGDPAAVPDALCLVAGARPGIDGGYRIAAVTHSLSRATGFVTQIELAHPESREAANAG